MTSYVDDPLLLVDKNYTLSNYFNGRQIPRRWKNADFD
jgi:hypothetical protein